MTNKCEYIKLLCQHNYTNIKIKNIKTSFKVNLKQIKK